METKLFLLLQRVFLSSFYTSYKGWKQVYIFPPEQKKCPFYTSYKGWKLDIESGINKANMPFLYFL